MIFLQFSRFGTAIMLLALAILPSGCNREHSKNQIKIPDVFKQNVLLGRGGNFGNILYKWNNWDKQREMEVMELMKGIGLTGIRINTRPFLHMDKNLPYALSDTFLVRLDWTVNEALRREFTVIIDNHQYRDMGADPLKLKEIFLSSWKQVAEHFKNYPDNVYFGVLNEPNGNLTPYLWNYIMLEAVNLIRKSNPARTLVIGPGKWNGIDALDELKLPEEDRNIIVEVHYYSPHRFTHQGTDGYDTLVTWLGTPEEKKAVEDDFTKAVEWGEKNKRPLFLGEFGVYKKADQESAVRWLAFVREQMEKGGMSWSMWDMMGSGMGIYDENKREWIQPRKDALLPPK